MCDHNFRVEFASHRTIGSIKISCCSKCLAVKVEQLWDQLNDNIDKWERKDVETIIEDPR